MFGLRLIHRTLNEGGLLSKLQVKKTFLLETKI